MSLVVLSSAHAQVGLPPIHISAHRPSELGAASGATPVAAPQEQQGPDQASAAQPDSSEELGVAQEAQIVNQKQIVRELPPIMDTARLIRDVPGVSTYEAGGVSRPAGDLRDGRRPSRYLVVASRRFRLRQSHGPRSPLGPSKVERVDVYSGVMPVSKAGDSIGAHDHRPAALACYARRPPPAAPVSADQRRSRPAFRDLPAPGTSCFGRIGGCSSPA